MSPTDWTARQRNLAKIAAPTADGQRLSVPPLDCMDELIARNVQQRMAHDCDIQGTSLVQLADEARNQLLAAAMAFTGTYCQGMTAPPSTTCGPLILTGHQPEIVHPGVWLKNFTAAHLASRCRGMAIHLIIDSDLCRAPAIHVPIGSATSPRTVAIPYDRPTDHIPLEQRPWVDRSVWDSFGTRVHRAISPLVPGAMVRSWWAQVAAPAAAAPTLGLGLARARHLTETVWLTSFPREIDPERFKADTSLTLPSQAYPSHCGHTLELPQSSVCQLPAFRRFAIHLLTQLPRFRDAYNGALAHYRRIHKIRNHAQPVPNLAEEDGWLEAPFWIWSTHDPTRRALWVRYHTDSLRLTDRHHFDERLPVTEDGLPDEAIDCLAAWEAGGVKLRTRALLTTLFARLLLADLFIHGIGGAKYDLVTNAIAAQFYGFAPPEFLTLSGTLRLPIDQPPVDQVPLHSDPSELSDSAKYPGTPYSVTKGNVDRPQKIAQAIRELTYHPELHIDLTSLTPAQRQTVQSLLQQKQQWIQTAKTPGNAAHRHRLIVQVNKILQPWLAAKRKRLEQELANAQRRDQANRILQSRKYAFCLFSADRLQDFLLDFSPSMT